MDKILAEGWKRLDRYFYKYVFPLKGQDKLCDDIKKIIDSLDKEKTFHRFRFKYDNNEYMITFHFITNRYVFIDLYNLDSMSKDVEFVFRDNTFKSHIDDDMNYRVMKYGIKKMMKENI